MCKHRAKAKAATKRRRAAAVGAVTEGLLIWQHCRAAIGTPQQARCEQDAALREGGMLHSYLHIHLPGSDVNPISDLLHESVEYCIGMVC